MTEFSVAALVVVYNKSCADSSTCRSLLNADSGAREVVIFDNSTRDFGNRALCASYGWHYLGGEGNLGLSKAYNAGIDYIKTLGNIDFISLFDDDTEISDAYFSSLNRAAKEHDAQVFVPLIYTGDRLISPTRISSSYRVTLLSKKEALSGTFSSTLTAINSGMAIRLFVYSDYRYDEHIFLDGIDHKFAADMHKRGIRFFVFPYACQHSFSGLEKPSKKAALHRFSIYAADFRYILNDQRFSYVKLVGKRAAHLSFQYHTFQFFFLFFKNLL